MALSNQARVAILYPGNWEARRNATPLNNRFADLFSAFAASGIPVEPAVYHDDFASEVRLQLLKVDGVLVWVNPIHEGRDRTVLDAMLRDVADAGIFVSAHPEVILKIGTKEVIHLTRELGWGSDTYLYTSLDQMREELPARLAAGKARVIKQNRGNGGDGVWKVQLPPNTGNVEPGTPIALLEPGTIVRVRHARRGSFEEEMALEEFFARCQHYFAAGGQMIDQEYQDRLPEGMIRCYLVGDTVAGFGHQAINALYPAPSGAPPTEAPGPGPRLYHPPAKPKFQALKRKLEVEWVPAAQKLLGIAAEKLPILWDCDFLIGTKDKDGEDTYVLCEINVSSVAPYPESAVPYIVEATTARVKEARQKRGLDTLR